MSIAGSGSRLSAPRTGGISVGQGSSVGRKASAGKKSGGVTLHTAEGRSHLGSVLLYAALVIETILVLIDESELPYSSMSLVFRGTFVLSLAALCLKPHGKKVWAALMLMMLFGVICWRITGRNEILRFTVFAAACGGEDLRRLLKTEFFLMLSGCLLIAMLSVTHLFGAVSLTADYRMDGGIETRYVLGFGHPNALHCMCLMLMLLAIAIWQKRFRWWHYLLLVIVNAGIYLLTDSRTGTAVGFLAIAFSLWMKMLEGPGEEPAAGADGVASGQIFRQGLVTAHYFAVAGLIVDAVAFSVWAAKISWDASNWWSTSYPVNQKLNGRIVELYYGAVERGSIDAWSLWGRRGTERYFDMGFVRLYYWYGIIPASLVILAILLLLFLCRRYRETGCLVVIACVGIYTVAEAHLVSVFIGRNYLVPVLGVLLSRWIRDCGSLHAVDRVCARRSS